MRRKRTKKIAATGHTPVTDAAVAPTCAETGLSEGSRCSVCGTVLVAQEILPKTEHAVVIDPAVPADCTRNGVSVGSHCANCGKILIPQTVTENKLGHTFIGGVCTRCHLKEEDCLE